MANMVQVIKKAALDALEESKPTEFQTGRIVQTAPLEISVDQRLKLDEDFLILGESMREKGLQAGDRVLILRVQHGQKYWIIDRA